MSRPASGKALRGLPPIVAAGSRVLILGSMPGTASLSAREYYAHPRNAFWAIVGTHTGIPPTAPYAERKAALLTCQVAVWDVLAGCRRPGSMDAAIDLASARANDFARFLARHRGIAWILFNGLTAERLWRRCVLPANDLPREPRVMILPSTSPAHAGLTAAAKARTWHRALHRALS